MPILFFPTSVIEKVATEKLIGRLVTQDLTLNRAVVRLLSETGILSKKQVEEIAIKVIGQYKEKYRKEIALGETKSLALKEAVNAKKLLIQRVQNAVTYEVSQKVRDTYRGKRYRWLPSDANEPDPLHQLKYGKVYTIGRGEMPGDRYGCQCGMEILTEEDQLLLTDELGL